MRGGSRARWAAVVALIAIVAAIVIALSVMGPAPRGTLPPDGNSTLPGIGNNGTGGTKPVVNVLATPSALAVMERWTSQYNIEGSSATVQVSYTDKVDDISISVLHTSISSFLAQHSADMAIMGRLPSGGGNFTYAATNSMFLPVSPQAIAIVYNIPAFPDVPSGLEFDPATLDRVLRGNITRWDDPAIKELNPGIDIPGEPITVVHEGEAGSASDLLAHYLNKTAIAWPEGAMPSGSAEGLSALVRQTPYSIGYVDYDHAAQTRMTYAALENSDGQFILPSAASISLAVQNGTATATQQQPLLAANATGAMMPPPVMPVGQHRNGSYPIVGFYYAAHAGDPEAADFVRWIATRGQEVLRDAQFTPLIERAQGNETMADNNNTTKAIEKEE